MSVTSSEVRPSRRIGAWALQAVVAAAFFAAGAAKLAAAPFMVQLFDQIGLGQWFRVVTGVVEIPKYVPADPQAPIESEPLS